MRDRPPRLARLEIEELFGPGTPRIDIAFRLDERLTVLHGRNGSGKTITLRLLDAICAKKPEVFRGFPLKLFRLTLEDGARVEIAEESGRAEFRAFPALGPKAPKTSPTSTPLDRLTSPSRSGEVHAAIRDMEMEMIPVRGDWEAVKRELASRLDAAPAAGSGVNNALHRREIERLKDEEGRLRRRLEHYESRLSELRFVDQPDTTLPRTKLISTHRLTHWNSDTALKAERPPAMVHHIGQQLGWEIGIADREYRTISTTLDSSLPRRIFEVQKTSCPTIDDLRQRYESVREQEEQLHRIGLIRDLPEPMDDARFTEEHRATLSVILQDREAKLVPFRRIGERTKLLLEMLNAKLHPKTVTLDASRGYQVQSPGGEPFDLALLSSGEQHELVLLHELLFDVEPGTLILIDEPELSLHVTWQEQVIPDLLKIAEVVDLDFVLATHSPYIVGDREDLMERIGEPLPGAEAAK